LSAPSTRSPVIVEDVVTALTGEVASGPGSRNAVKDRLQRATDEFDERTAEAFARALFDSLSQDPTDLRQLEALVILGISHPNVLEQYRISLDREAERLVFLLERAGEQERADSLRELLDERLTVQEVESPAAPAAPVKDDRQERVELNLRRADEAALSGRTKDAIACLQEVLRLEPGRRDVSRMIRDLRYEQKERRWRLGRRVRAVAIAAVVAAACWGVWMREQSVRAEFAAIAPAKNGDAPSLRARLGAIEDLVARQHVWFAMHDAVLERERIQRELEHVADAQGRLEHQRSMQAEERLQNADAARLRGLMYAQQGKFEEALGDFREALELAPTGWEHTKRVRADLAAIEAFKAQSKRTGESNR
jgi:tetratricopeptide (TPR) repeat protein